MVGEWMSPLVTSALRLVVITMLFAVNCAAVFRTCRLPKYRGAFTYKWITILTILILNLTYLSIIWAPFTITTFKYNLQDLNKPDTPQGTPVPSTYILEYLDRRNGTVVQETKLGTVLGETSSGQLVLPEGKGPQELVTVGFDELRKLERDLAPPAQPGHSRLGDSLNQWITQVQDLVTSSFSYSLILTTVLRKIMAEKGVVLGRIQAALCSALLTLIPIPLTLATRDLANTTQQFALHTSQISTSGYTMYSIICDVNITENYVVGLFLECTVVLLLAAILLVVTHRGVRYSLSSPEEDGELHHVEEVACKFVLALGAGWAWPLKPVLVTILFCINGPHWSNVVCWLANMVVAIPVVFVPLAVFLSRPDESHHCSDYDVFTDDPENTEAAPVRHLVDQSTSMDVEKEANKDVNSKLSVQAVVLSPVRKAVASSDVLDEVPQKGNQARENLKFYLGTDIFKDKKEDEVCILTKSCLTPDGNESAV